MDQNRYIIETSAENPDLSRNEIVSIKDTYNNFDIIYNNEKFFLVRGDMDNLKDGAFVNYISRILDKKDNFERLKADIPDGKFFVRASGCGKNESEFIESSIGKILNGKGRISFTSPNFKIRVIKVNEWYLCIQTYEKNKKDLESRRAPLRPFFSPVSLHPKYARYIVNTSYTKKDDTLLDPFCGTGGILIEAALTGRKIIGNDASLNMVMGAKLNLKYFDIKNAVMYNQDINNLKLDKNVDAIVTDMPYGRSSTLNKNDIQNLYKNSFEKFNEFLKPHGHCSIIINNLDFLEYSKKYFKINKTIPVYQHKSLTRFFIAMEKIN